MCHFVSIEDKVPESIETSIYFLPTTTARPAEQGALCPLERNEPLPLMNPVPYPLSHPLTLLYPKALLQDLLGLTTSDSFFSP